jgi:hypothetical protein
MDKDNLRSRPEQLISEHMSVVAGMSCRWGLGSTFQKRRQKTNSCYGPEQECLGHPSSIELDIKLDIPVSK